MTTRTKVVFTAVSAALFLLALESAFRVRVYLEDRKLLSAERLEQARTPAKGSVLLGQMIRVAEVDRIIYELRPGLDVQFMGARVTTNRAGFRDRDYAEEKPPGTVRIVGLGDSYMFGWGVSDGEDYLSVLEEALNRQHPERRWEVINTAVPGYNAVMEVETLKAKGLRYEPDVVVVGYCGNDADLPNFIREKEDPFTLEKSFGVQFLLRRLGKKSPGRRRALTDAPRQKNAKGRPTPYEDDPERVPSQYRDMVGRDAYQRAMKELAEIGHAKGLDVLVVFFPNAPRNARDVTEGLGFATVDTNRALRFLMRERGIEVFLGSDLTVGKKDPHPSAVAHRMIGEVLFQYMVEKNLVAKYAAGS